MNDYLRQRIDENEQTENYKEAITFELNLSSEKNTEEKADRYIYHYTVKMTYTDDSGTEYEETENDYQVMVMKRKLTIVNDPTASDLSYKQILSDSILTGGVAMDAEEAETDQASAINGTTVMADDGYSSFKGVDGDSAISPLS